MIVTRTPFRVTLGGGGTDLPSYYEKHGGFIFAMGLSKYMYLCVNRQVVNMKHRILFAILATNQSAHARQQFGKYEGLR